MLEIKITGATKADASLLRGLADLLENVTAVTLEGRPRTVTTIAHADIPATGADDPNDPDPAAVFARAATSQTAPVATAAASAPASNTNPAPVPNGSTVDLDADGLPWDVRIHSSSKEKNKTDNKWRARRGVDDATVASVTAELRQVMGLGNAAASPAASAPVAAIVPPPPPAPPVVHSAPNGAPPPPPPTSSDAVPAASGGANPGSAGSAAPMTFRMLVPKVTAALGAQQITQAQIKETLDSLGLPTLPSLAHREDLVPTVATLLGIA